MAIDVLNQTVTTRGEVIALAAFAGVTGLGLIVLGLHPAAPTQRLPAGSVSLKGPILSTGRLNPPGGGSPTTVSLSGAPITLPLSNSLTIIGPSAVYQGSGMNTYTYAWIEQNGSQVYGSGIAGVAVGAGGVAIASPMAFPLVAPDQPQPVGPAGPFLTLYGLPAAIQQGIALCGRAALPGPADLFVAIYGSCCENGDVNGPDCLIRPGVYATPCSAQDGFSSPSCNPRLPYLTSAPILINLVAG